MGSDNWAVYSQDGSLAAHFEHTVAITAEGPRILTPWHLAAGERGPPGRRLPPAPDCYSFRSARGRLLGPAPPSLSYTSEVTEL